MSNYTTTLIFHGEEQHVVPRISPAALSRLTSTLEALYRAVLDRSGFAGTIEFSFSAEPQRGSLRIVLATVLRASLNWNKRTKRSALANRFGTDTDAMLLATVATMAWQIACGDNSLLEMRQNIMPDASKDVSDVELELRKPLSSDETTTAIFEVLRAARSTGALRVEIQIPDNSVTVIYHEGDRDLGDKLGDDELKLASHYEIGRVNINGRPSVLFSAETADGPVPLIVPASRRNSIRNIVWGTWLDQQEVRGNHEFEYFMTSLFPHAKRVFLATEMD